jgi:hypothetical protein
VPQTLKPRPILVGCLDATRRKRIESALSGVVRMHWHSSFRELSQTVAASSSSTVVMIGGRDGDGMPAGPVATEIARSSPRTAIIMYASHREVVGGVIDSPAFTDLIIAGETDGKVFVLDVVLNAVKRMGADHVSARLRERLPPALAVFADAAVRYPSCATVEALAERIGVHRQTAAVWCRKERFLRPEELLIWSRLLLVAVLLEHTDIPAGTIAQDLDFPSAVSLRNQLKRYTGLTALEIREAGLEAVLAAFDREVERVRGMASKASPDHDRRPRTVAKSH